MRRNWIRHPLRALGFAAICCLTTTAMPTKQITQLLDYHNSGRYYQDLSAAIKEATCYVQFRLTQNARRRAPKPLAIVFDIDETLVSNFKGLSEHAFDTHWLIPTPLPGTALPHSLALYNYVRDHHVAIFLLTTRQTSSLSATAQQLNRLGYRGWTALIGRPGGSKPLDYRYYVHARQRILQQGYAIMLNIGTQPVTLRGGAADMTLRLPNPFYSIGESANQPPPML